MINTGEGAFSLKKKCSECKAFVCFVADLIHCTNEPNVSIPHLANLLIERTGHSSWVVVFKSLVTVHNLMCYGNEVNSLLLLL